MRQHEQVATLSQGVPRDAAVNFCATGIIGVADMNGWKLGTEESDRSV